MRTLLPLSLSLLLGCKAGMSVHDPEETGSPDTDVEADTDTDTDSDSDTDTDTDTDTDIDWDSLHGTVPSSPVAAPDFVATNMDDSPRTRSALLGHRTVLWFYNQAYSEGCSDEGHSFQQLLTQFQGYQVEIVGVAYEDPETNRAWAADNGFTMELWTEATNRRLAKTYGAYSSSADMPRRVSVLLDEQGDLVLEYKSVDPKTHPGKVYADVRAIWGE